jgi:uncharacterized protein YeeX (DUF496 family)
MKRTTPVKRDLVEILNKLYQTNIPIGNQKKSCKKQLDDNAKNIRDNGNQIISPKNIKYFIGIFL